MVQRFASNVRGSILLLIHKRLLKCVVDVVASPVPSITKFTDVLPRGCNMETLETPKCPILVGRYCCRQWFPTRFGLDVQRPPAVLRPEQL